MANLVIRLIGDTKEFNAALDNSQRKLGTFGAESTKFGTVAKAGFAAAGLAAVGFGAFAVKSALEGQRAHAQLDVAIKNTGHSYSEYGAKIDESSAKLAKFGFENDEVEGAITTLTRATHNAGKATELMGLAADISRARHIGLSEASSLLAKVELGRYSVLTRLGVASKEQVANIKNEHQATQLLSNLYGGSAAANAKTFEGQVEALQAQFKNFAEQVGTKAIPVLNTLLHDSLSVIDAFEKANKATDGWLGKIVLFTAGVSLATVAVGKLVVASESVPLIGASLARFGPAAIGIGATAIALRQVGGALSGLLVGSSSGKDIDSLAASLRTFAKTGNLVGESAKDLGDKFKKLAGNIRDLPHNDPLENIATGTAHFLGITDASQAAIDKVQKSLLKLYQTDPSSALTAYDRIKQGLEGQGLTAEKVDKVFKKFNDTTGLVGEALKPPTEQEQKFAAASAEAAQKTKEHTKALDELATVAGPSSAKFAKALGFSTSAVKTLIQNVKDIDSAFTSAFDGAANALDDFKDKSHVDFQAFIKDEFDHLVATQNWASNIAKLANDGIDKGFLKTLVDAGPASAGVVQSILDNVSKGSIGTVNKIAEAQRTAKTETIKTLNEVETGAKAFTDYINGLKPILRLELSGTGQQIIQGSAALHQASGGLLGKRAAGGPVAGGSAYLVGERGPELFVPRDSGTILPNSVTSGIVTQPRPTSTPVAASSSSFDLKQTALADFLSAGSGLVSQSGGSALGFALLVRQARQRLEAFTQTLRKYAVVGKGHQAFPNLVRVLAAAGEEGAVLGSRIFSQPYAGTVESDLGKYRSAFVSFDDVRHRLEGRATGGPVTAGRGYLVGERGPELYVKRGTNWGGGGGVVINLEVHALNAQDAGSEVVKALKDWTRTNGPLPTSILG